MPIYRTIAVTQMEVTPAPTAQRLERAGRLVEAAAAQGAELVLLPEFFNTGYAYEQVNYERAETMHGATVAWMKETASLHKVYLAGSLLLAAGRDLYNALLLVSPERYIWRYDKLHPWAWERAYCVNGTEPVIASTRLGEIGLMVCADVAHPDLWKRYAGQIDLILVASSAPDIGSATLSFPSAGPIPLAEITGPTLEPAVRTAFGDWLVDNARWLGAPVAVSAQSGQFRSYLPNGWLSTLLFLPASPRLGGSLIEANNLRLTAPMVAAARILDGSGQVVASLPLEQEDGFAVARVKLAEGRPAPSGSQPELPAGLRVGNLLSDLLALLSIPVYRRGLRRAHGPEMAPLHPETRKRLALFALVSLLIAALFFRPRRKRAPLSR